MKTQVEIIARIEGVFATRKTALGFVGIFTLKENGKMIWSRSTKIHRLTR